MIKLKWILIVIFCSSCVVDQESYDNASDDGTYTGVSSVYAGGALVSADLKKRTCPDISVVFTVNDGVFSLSTSDSYTDGFVPHANVVTEHTTNGYTYGNNRFEAKTTWEIETTDTQLADLRTLKVCGASSSPASNGRLSNLAFRVSEDYIVGQYGLGKARGTMVYGVDCTDGEFVPVCIYYMDLVKN